MKKLFLVGAVALSSLFLSGCGGGSGEDVGYLGVKSFANGAKFLRYGVGIIFDIKSANGYVDVTSPEDDGTSTLAGSARFDAYLYGVTEDDSPIQVYCTYTITDADGSKALLTLDMTSVDKSAFKDENIRKAFGYPADIATDAGWTTLQGFETVQYNLDFNSGALSMKASYTLDTDKGGVSEANETKGVRFYVLK